MLGSLDRQILTYITPSEKGVLEPEVVGLGHVVWMALFREECESIAGSKIPAGIKQVQKARICI